MAAVLVQSATNSSGTTTATSVAVGSTQGWAAPAAGNLLVAWADSDATVTVSNSMTAGPSVVDGNGAYVWWKIAAGTETSTTFTPSAGATLVAGILEYSGVAGFDVQPTPSTTTGIAANSTTAVTGTGTGTAGDLWIAAALVHADNGIATAPTGPTWSGGFTNRQTGTAGVVNSTAYCVAYVADFQNTAAGSVTTQCTWTGGAMQDRQELLIGFKLSGGAAPALPPPGILFIGPTRG